MASWEDGKGRSSSMTIYDRVESARLRSEWRLATTAKYRPVLRAQHAGEQILRSEPLSQDDCVMPQLKENGG
jgi:hypothetical protein